MTDTKTFESMTMRSEDLDIEYVYLNDANEHVAALKAAGVTVETRFRIDAKRYHADDDLAALVHREMAEIGRERSAADGPRFSAGIVRKRALAT